jgi:hypothetical protein
LRCLARLFDRPGGEHLERPTSREEPVACVLPLSDDTRRQGVRQDESYVTEIGEAVVAVRTNL